MFRKLGKKMAGLMIIGALTAATCVSSFAVCTNHNLRHTVKDNTFHYTECTNYGCYYSSFGRHTDYWTWRPYNAVMHQKVCSCCNFSSGYYQDHTWTYMSTRTKICTTCGYVN